MGLWGLEVLRKRIVKATASLMMPQAFTGSSHVANLRMAMMIGPGGGTRE